MVALPSTPVMTEETVCRHRLKSLHPLEPFGARTVELNLEPSDALVPFDDERVGLASALVPAWVDEVIAADTSGAPQ